MLSLLSSLLWLKSLGIRIVTSSTHMWYRICVARVPQYSVSVSSANGSQKPNDLSSFLDPPGRPLS
jgi:uncharacterized membrane protein